MNVHPFFDLYWSLGCMIPGFSAEWSAFVLRSLCVKNLDVTKRITGIIAWGNAIAEQTSAVRLSVLTGCSWESLGAWQFCPLFSSWEQNVSVASLYSGKSFYREELHSSPLETFYNLLDSAVWHIAHQETQWLTSVPNLHMNTGFQSWLLPIRSLVDAIAAIKALQLLF